MDYEKKYKEALERAKDIKFGNPNSATANVVCEEIFPELAESEDEKIRQEILEYIDKETGCKEWIAWLEKQGEPQSYKGNADTMRKNLIKAFKSVGSKHWGGFDVRDIIHFLESKDAIELERQCEQNTAWSEEDEKMYKAISIALSLNDAKGYLCSWHTTPEEADNWLKSLKVRVQPQWKPTDEQLMALRDAIDNNEMESLYNDLKKL